MSTRRDGVLAAAERAGPARSRWPARRLGRVPPTAQVLAGIVSVQIGAALAKQLFRDGRQHRQRHAAHLLRRGRPAA